MNGVWQDGTTFGNCAGKCKAKATFLIIDEDTIDNGIASIELISFGQPLCGGGNPSVCVNDDIADPRDDRAGSSCL